jgi:HD-like signal output (HDOD) protein
MPAQQATRAQPLTESIQNAVASGKVALPPLPDLAMRLMELLKNEDAVSSKQVAELVRSDPAVAATLLKWANSAAFGGLHPVYDLNQAVARLGFRQVTSAVTAAAHSGHFQSDNATTRALLKSLWGHAVGTAMAARRVATLAGHSDEEAFVAGLLHDSGKLLVLKALDYLETRIKDLHVTTVVLDELMEVMHTGLGHKVLLSWRLPEPICEVALHHHDEDVGIERTLIVCVQMADAVSRKIGEHPSPDPDLNLLETRAAEQLNITDLELASMMVDLEDDIAEVKNLL